jgi:hypothetical protein
VAVVAAGVLWAAWPDRPLAHKTVISKFTYYQDVLPILQARCASCHRDQGVARNLLTYEAAANFPWGIQQELLSRRMPPWPASPGLAPIKGHQWLSPTEFDTLITWAAGGTPAGTPAPAAAPDRPSPAWPLGPPDLILPMPAAVTLERDRAALDHEVDLPLGAASGRWIRALDLQPGTPAIVRRAEFEVRDSSGQAAIACCRTNRRRPWKRVGRSGCPPAPY